MPEPQSVTASRFPAAEVSGFRTDAWKLGVPKTAEELVPLYPTLLHALSQAARLAGEHGVTLVSEADEEVKRSYASLYEDVRRLAATLRQRGLVPGERVLLVLPTSFEFITAFFAVGLAGGVAVPAAPPASRERLEAGLSRLANVATHAGARLCLTTARFEALLGELALRCAGLRQLVGVEALLAQSSTPLEDTAAEAGQPALIQYTSGSTGRPKGAVLTHGNLTANIHAIGQALCITREDVTVSWAPLHHDMGLIGTLLFSIYWRIPLVLLAPASFQLRPASWLWAIHRHKGTLSPAPNFAFALCVKRVRPDERAGLDLSSWRLALNGSEPVNLRTIADFQDAYEPHGFRREAMFPVYGLAECALAVSFPRPGEMLHYEVVDRGSLAEGQAVPARGNGALANVCLGRPLPGHEIRIAADDGEPLPERWVGHILVRGPSCMTGYFGDPETSAAALKGGWLWTGDLGYLANEALFVTGRAKDLIILRGRNHYPEDVERVIERMEGMRPGGAIVFAVYDERSAQDRVVAVCELAQDATATPERIAEIRAQVAEHCELQLDEVVLVPPKTLPRTSSGKRQRGVCKRQYLADALGQERTGVLKQAWLYARSRLGRWALALKRGRSTP